MRIFLVALVASGVVMTGSVRARETQIPPREFHMARLHYGGGGDWYTGPSMIPNLMRYFTEVTGIPALDRELVVRLTDDDLLDHPYLFMTGHGNVRFTSEEMERLRAYLAAGGFLHADDNYGMDESFRREMARVFPNHPLIELSLDHPIYNSFFHFPNGLPKVHEHDGKPPQGFGIILDGRLAVFYAYECDLGNGWESPEVHDNPEEIRLQALMMGVNIVIHSLTQ